MCAGNSLARLPPVPPRPLINPSSSYRPARLHSMTGGHANVAAGEIVHPRRAQGRCARRWPVHSGGCARRWPGHTGGRFAAPDPVRVVGTRQPAPSKRLARPRAGIRDHLDGGRPHFLRDGLRDALDPRPAQRPLIGVPAPRARGLRVIHAWPLRQRLRTRRRRGLRTLAWALERRTIARARARNAHDRGPIRPGCGSR